MGTLQQAERCQPAVGMKSSTRVKPAATLARINAMTTHDTPSALLTGALAGYLLAEYGPGLAQFIHNVIFIWS